MKTTEFHNRVLAVRDDLAIVLDCINRLDPESFKELDSDAVLRLIEAQAALTEAERLIDAPMIRRAVERSKSHA
jgi:hypothetical protein